MHTHGALSATGLSSPQFHLLGITFTSIAMGGMGIFSVAKPMMSEVPPRAVPPQRLHSQLHVPYLCQVFSGTLPDLVTSAFAAQFLLCLSLANLGELPLLRSVVRALCFTP